MYSYHGDSDVIEYSFETVHNLDLYGCELAPTVREGMRAWNMTVQYWLATYVYKRIPVKAAFIRFQFPSLLLNWISCITCFCCSLSVEGVCSFVVLHVKLKCVVKPSLTAARVGWIEIRVQILPFVKKIVERRPIPDTRYISKRGSFSNYCKIFRKNRRLLSSEIWAPEKSWFWVDQNSAPIFRHLWTKVHRIRYTCTMVIVCDIVFWLTIACSFRRYLLVVVTINQSINQSIGICIAPPTNSGRRRLTMWL